MPLHPHFIDRGNNDPSPSAKSSSSSLANNEHMLRSKNSSNTTFSDEDVSDDTISSSDGSFRPPVLSDYANALLQDPAAGSSKTDKLKAKIVASFGMASTSPALASVPLSTTHTLQASASTPSISSASSSTTSLRLGGAFPGSGVTSNKHKFMSPRARASPINGSRQQHEIQRHLNRVRLELKSTSEDDLKGLANGGSRLRHYSSVGSNSSFDEKKHGPTTPINVPLVMSRSTGSLRNEASTFDSIDRSTTPNTTQDQPEPSQEYQEPQESKESKESKEPQEPQESQESPVPAASPSSDPSEDLKGPAEDQKDLSSSSLGATIPAKPRAQLSTVRAKRFGRGLGPPKRAVPRESEEELTDEAVSNAEISEDLGRVPGFPAVVDHETELEPDTKENDKPRSPSPAPVPDRLDATESDAARKRRSELYIAAERAHAIPEFEEKPDSAKSEMELERERTLERQHQELRHYLQIQEQLIQQQQHQLKAQQLQQQSQLQQPPSSFQGNSDDPVAVQMQQQQQYILMQQQQQQQQQIQQAQQQGQQGNNVSANQSQPTSRKQKNMILVNNQSYQRLELIGRGGSSKVYKAQAGNGKVYAIKRVSCDDDIDLTVLKGFKGEIDLLQRLKSEDRVVKLIDYEMRASSIYVIMECGEIDLAHVLNARLSQPLDISFVRYYAVEMLHCVSAVHRHDIVHSDLKPANFLLVKGMLKIIDFGIANVVPDYTSNVHRDTQIGTPNYMAPEALLDANHVYAKPPDTKPTNDSNDANNDKKINVNNRNSIISLNNSNIHAPIPIPTKPAATKFKVGRPSDLWSCGCIIYQMIYGRPPYGGYQGTQRMLAIMNPKVQIAYPKQGLGAVRVPKEAIEAIKGCLERDPTQRMTIDDVMNGSFLNPQAVDRKFIQDLLAHAVKYGAERGSAMNGKEVELLTDNVWKKIQASNL